jgi:hypothetical protein
METRGPEHRSAFDDRPYVLSVMDSRNLRLKSLTSRKRAARMTSAQPGITMVKESAPPALHDRVASWPESHVQQLERPPKLFPIGPSRERNLVPPFDFRAAGYPAGRLSGCRPWHTGLGNGAVGSRGFQQRWLRSRLTGTPAAHAGDPALTHCRELRMAGTAFGPDAFAVT